MKRRRHHSPQETKEDNLDLYFKEITPYGLIDQKKEKVLTRRIKKGDPKALEELIKANVRFVITVAKRHQHLGLSLPDLIAEGNMGLLRAAFRFDERRGVRFISYAVWWIRQAILQVLAEQSKIMRVPINQMGELKKFSDKKESLRQRGKRPTIEAVAEEMGKSPEEIEWLSKPYQALFFS